MRDLPVLFVFITLFLAGCGSGDGQSPSKDLTQSASPTTDSTAGAEEGSAEGMGDPENGEALFQQPMLGAGPGCKTCHSLSPGVRMVGPSLANAASAAAKAGEKMSARQFLHQSIVDPNAQITEGFPPGLMYSGYGDSLSPRQIDDLVAFLMTRD